VNELKAIWILLTLLLAGLPALSGAIDFPAGAHTYYVGVPGINEFVINWTDSNNYSKIRSCFFDNDVNSDRVVSKQGRAVLPHQTYYSIDAFDANTSNISLSFDILWHPNEKRDPEAKLDSIKYIPLTGHFTGLNVQDALSKSELTIQDKEALMATWAGTKEYVGSELGPYIHEAQHEGRYFLDDYTEVIISGDVIDWSAQEFKAMLSTVKITPPEGYY
jgi:hypothetical protein